MNTNEPQPSDYPIVKIYNASYANGDPSPWAQVVLKPGQQLQPDGEYRGWVKYEGPTLDKPMWYAL